MVVATRQQVTGRLVTERDEGRHRRQADEVHRNTGEFHGESDRRQEANCDADVGTDCELTGKSSIGLRKHEHFL